MRSGEKLRRDAGGRAIAPGMPSTRPQLDRVELAWAAGFFDGEGSTFVASRGHYPVIGISQSDDDGVPAVLDRFRAAVGGYGHINGPFFLAYGDFKIKWIYRVHGYEMVRAVISQIWPWLGTAKQLQAVSTLLDYRLWNPPRTRTPGTTFGQPFKDFCKRGHDLSLAQVSPGRSRECIPCRHDRYIEKRVKRP